MLQKEDVQISYFIKIKVSKTYKFKMMYTKFLIQYVFKDKYILIKILMKYYI